jgi:Flp pilus assembly protein TadG
MRLPTRLRRLSPRNERGQTLVLVVFLLPALLGLSAGGFDVGSWYLKNHQARSVADAAALAAAAQLGAGSGSATSCVDGPAAIAAAQSSFNTNKSALGPAAAISVTPCYDPSQDGVTGVTAPLYYAVKVVITTTAPAYLSKVLGFGTINVSASAIAARAASTSPESIFANGGPSNPETPGVGCGKEESGIYLKGNDASIGGGVVSNGTFQVIGSGNTAAAGTYYNGPPPICVPAVAAGNTFAGQGQPAADPKLEPFPYNFGCDIAHASNCVDQFSCHQWESNPTGAPADVHFPALTGRPPSLDTSAWNIQTGTKDQHGTVVVSNGALADGTYCNTALAGGCGGKDQCNIKIDIGKGVTCSSGCNVTFVADKVELYQPGASYTPYENNVAAFGVPKPGDCGANHEIHFSADNAGWSGILFAPCGDIEFGQGGKSSGTGDTNSTVDNVHCTACVIEGRYVEILGDDFTMNGAGPPVPVGQEILAK